MSLFPSAPAAAPALAWRRFGLTFAAAAVGVAAALYGFVAAVDPYGTRVRPGRAPGPIMDLNQRFMYPQIVRSGRYDSAVFGTSTVRLLDPAQLGELFQARFANLGMNAGTPWEQAQLAALFLRYVPAPKAIVLGLDATWCEPDADRKRVTFRAFPPWLYDENPLNDWPELMNLRSVEIAGRVVLNRLGLMPPRIGPDGFEIFVPSEDAYDLDRARDHIRRTALQAGRASEQPLPAVEGAASAAPALSWLDHLLASIPRQSEKILLFPPIHAAAQPAVGSPGEAADWACKARIAEIARARDATLLDFRRRSAVTTEDSNYWDALHYRVGVAQRIAAALRNAQAGKGDPADGFYRVLAPPRGAKGP
jgi:hypothetical protein